MTAALHLFGGAALMSADGVLVAGAAAQPRRVAVLAVLADAWPAPVTRDRLVGLIWPDQDEQGARRLLTQALYALKRELGEFTRASGRDVVLNPDVLQVDLVEFRRAVAAGDHHRAAALYRGPVLDGVHVRGAVEFERWLEALRDTTRRQFHTAVEQIGSECSEAGNWREAAHWAERLVRELPYDAPASLRLIECWLEAGDRGAALAAATSYERRIRTELEIEPDPAVRRRIRDAVHAAAVTEPEPPLPAPAPSDQPAATTVDTGPRLQPAATSNDTGSRPQAERHARESRHLRWLAGTVVAAGLGMAMLLARSSPVRSEARVLALPPVEIRGDSSLAGFAATARRVLVANLDEASGTHVITTDTAMASDPWARLRMQLVAVGDQIRLDAELVESGRATPPQRAFSVIGPRDSLLVLAERLSIELLPALYPASVAKRVGAVAIASFRSAAAARHFLDGESAMRRGAATLALEHLTAATRLDSTNARAWYRRALAADAAHRMDDADASLRAALAADSSLPERRRVHLQAYRHWRAGNARTAESLYRDLLTGDASDREAWVQLGEIMFHAGPLHGRPLDHARDPWYRAVAADSGDVPALMHAVRVAARARDMRAVDALLDQAGRAGAAGVPLAESRVIAAYARGDRRALAGAGRILDSIPEYSLQFLHGIVAGHLEEVAAAEGIARRMVAPTRPAALQGQGYLALAHLALAQGRWRDAMTALDSAKVRNAVAAAWARAYFATLPFVQLADEERVAIARQLDAVPEVGTAAPLYLQVGVALPAAAAIQPYLVELLRQSATDPAAGATSASAGVTMSCTPDPADASILALCTDLRLALSAEPAWRAGRAGEALQLLERMEMRVPYQYAARSQFYARSRERFLRASLLAQAGRGEEAEAWYAASVHGAWADYVFLAPSHLGLARARERRGDRAGAALHYRKVLAVVRDPDPEMAALRRDAEAGLARVER